MTPLDTLPVALNPAELRSVPRPGGRTPEDARKAAMEFEQMFLAQLLNPIFDAIPADGPFGGGSGEKMFRSFQVDAYAKAIVQRGGIGIADAVTREILMLQEKANG
ncbi:MAG TPA: rod-binding protein [Alphaproteobacteria bacterium]